MSHEATILWTFIGISVAYNAAFLLYAKFLK